MSVNAIRRQNVYPVRTVYAWILALYVSVLILLVTDAFRIVPSYRISSLIILLCGFSVVYVRGVLSFPTIIFTIIFFPAFAPFYAWDIKYAVYFSLAARDLQYDMQVVNMLTWVFATGAITYSLITCVSKQTPYQDRFNPPIVATMPFLPALILGLLVCISAYVIDPGAIVWSATYSQVLEGRFSSSQQNTIWVVAFGGMWTGLFLFARHHKTLFWTITIVSAVWLFLHVRRVEVFGMVLVLSLWMKTSLPPRRVIIILSLFIFLQFIMGEVRTVGIKAALGGASLDPSGTAVTLGRASLPGGASNVYLAGLHVINVRLSGLLPPEAMFTMVEWLKGLLPGQFWVTLGVRPARTEHNIIFEDLNLVYVGGLPLISVFFLNGGIFLVAVFGILNGLFANFFEGMIKIYFEPNKKTGGNFILLILMVCVFYLFRLHWYNPQTPIRALEMTGILYLFFRYFIQFRRPKPSKFGNH